MEWSGGGGNYKKLILFLITDDVQTMFCDCCGGESNIIHTHAKKPTAKRRRRRSRESCQTLSRKHKHVVERVHTHTHTQKRTYIITHRLGYHSTPSQNAAQAVDQNTDARPQSINRSTAQSRYIQIGPPPLSLLLALFRRRNLLARIGIRIPALDHDAVAGAVAHAEAVLPFDVVALTHRLKGLFRVRQPLVLKAGDLAVVAVVVFKGIGLLAVDGVVADFAHFVRHAQGHAADVLDEAHDERGPNDVPADDEEGADDLQPDLSAVASDGAAGVGETKGRAAFFGCPET